MTRTSKILGFSVPPVLAREVEALAKEERRTKSELFREMVRIYKRFRPQRVADEWNEERILKIIKEAKEEQRKNPMSVEEMLKEEEQLARYGRERAKKMGLKTDMKSINRMIHEFRAEKRKAQGRS
jgi:metal-responsive CopG/Arc/MetJ family transcriptional regulator